MTIRALRALAGGRTGSPAGRGATLTDEEAYELFDGTCDQPYARAFKLHRIYTQAAAFAAEQKDRDR